MSRGVGSRTAELASRVWHIANRLGWAHVALWACASVGRRFSTLRIFVVVIHPVDAPTPELAPDADTASLEFRVLTPQDMDRFASDTDFRFSRAFASEAVSRGDICFGIVERERLLSYCWYSRGVAPVFEDIEVAVDFPFIYGYNAYTDGAHRGRGLHVLGVCAAASRLEPEGFEGITAYIEADNVAPLMAARKMGEDFAGFVFLHRLFGRWRWLTTSGCRKAGFRVSRRAVAAELVSVSKQF